MRGRRQGQRPVKPLDSTVVAQAVAVIQHLEHDMTLAMRMFDQPVKYRAGVIAECIPLSGALHPTWPRCRGGRPLMGLGGVGG